MNTAKDIFQRAEQAARKGNFEYSIELYLQGLTINPKAADERQTLHRIEAQLVESNGGNPAGGVATKLKTKVSHAKVKRLEAGQVLEVDKKKAIVQVFEGGVVLCGVVFVLVGDWC